jgi:hypothetical protein
MNERKPTAVAVAMGPAGCSNRGGGKMRSHLLAAAAAAVSFSVTAAIAEEFADIKGKWVGKVEAVALGTPTHVQNPSPDPRNPGLSESDVTLTITGQQGARFWGTFASAGGSEPIIGVFSGSRDFVFVDHDGYTSGTVRADGVIEWVYGRGGDTMVAAHAILKHE